MRRKELVRIVDFGRRMVQVGTALVNVEEQTVELGDQHYRLEYIRDAGTRIWCVDGTPFPVQDSETVSILDTSLDLAQGELETLEHPPE